MACFILRLALSHYLEGQVTTMLHLDKTFLPIEANVEDMLCMELERFIYSCRNPIARNNLELTAAVFFVPDVLLDGGHLVLIFNAAIPSPRILQMLPKYTFKHYTYLRDKYPDCFPEPTVG